MDERYESSVCQTTSSIDNAWEGILKDLSGLIPSSILMSVLSQLKPISIENGSITLGVPNSFTRELIESSYLEPIRHAASSVLKREVSVSLVILPQSETQNPAEIDEKNDQFVTKPYLESNNEGKGGKVIAEIPQIKKYTFENFVVGDSNKFAYNASLMVSEMPGRNYNPLFIYGGTGLGKTHLLYAIKDYAEKLHPNIKVRYVRTSEFIDEFVVTITLKRDKATFDKKYINNKIVLFDDIQALSGTDATQTKFFDIFNVLYGSDSHIVLSSDRPPRDMAQLSDRIQSRFEGGLIIDIKPPDLETRLAILRMRARAESIDIPDDVLVFIASMVKDNIRTLEGHMNIVVAYARLYGLKIDLPMAQEVLKDQFAEQNPSKSATVELIQSVVSNYYRLPVADLTGQSRSRSLVYGRQIAMYLSRELTNETLISIGSQFGGRDHSTVLHSCHKVESLLRSSRDTLKEVSELTNTVNRSICGG